jgi:hypothetical protein
MKWRMFAPPDMKQKLAFGRVFYFGLHHRNLKSDLEHFTPAANRQLADHRGVLFSDYLPFTQTYAQYLKEVLDHVETVVPRDVEADQRERQITCGDEASVSPRFGCRKD